MHSLSSEFLSDCCGGSGACFRNGSGSSSDDLSDERSEVMNARPEAEGLKYGGAEEAKGAETLEFFTSRLGQRNPQHCPHPAEAELGAPPECAPLGEPLSIDDVAELLGCSPWTIRQRYLRQGLPH